MKQPRQVTGQAHCSVYIKNLSQLYSALLILPIVALLYERPLPVMHF